MKQAEGLGSADGAEDSREVSKEAFQTKKVLNKNGKGSTSSVIAALEFAVANRARFNIQVVNLSLGHVILAPAADDPSTSVTTVDATATSVLILEPPSPPAGNWHCTGGRQDTSRNGRNAEAGWRGR